MAGPAGATKKEPGEAEIVKIPSGKEIATVMRAQINNYTSMIETNLKGKGPDEIPGKVRDVAQAMGFWNDEKGITDLKKFTAQLNGVLQESMKMMGKEGCFDELCDGAKGGQPMTKPMYLTFEGATKFDMSNSVLKDVMVGFGKHLDRAMGEGKDIAVNFKNVGFSDDGAFVEVKLNWVGPVKALEMQFSRNEPNEFTGKKKEGLDLPKVVPRKIA